MISEQLKKMIAENANFLKEERFKRFFANIAVAQGIQMQDLYELSKMLEKNNVDYFNSLLVQDLQEPNLSFTINPWVIPPRLKSDTTLVVPKIDASAKIHLQDNQPNYDTVHIRTLISMCDGQFQFPDNIKNVIIDRCPSKLTIPFLACNGIASWYFPKGDYTFETLAFPLVAHIHFANGSTVDDTANNWYADNITIG